MINFFNKNKTKWQPILMYNPVATSSINIVYARYDKKTGLYDLQIANLAKQLGLTKPKGRAKTELTFKKGG